MDKYFLDLLLEISKKEKFGTVPDLSMQKGQNMECEYCKIEMPLFQTIDRSPSFIIDRYKCPKCDAIRHIAILEPNREITLTEKKD